MGNRMARESHFHTLAAAENVSLLKKTAKNAFGTFGTLNASL
jgi:hypothetical protein